MAGEFYTQRIFIMCIHGQVIRVKKLRRIRLPGNVISTGATRKAYKILANKHKSKEIT